jgi:hypothetical protein
LFNGDKAEVRRKFVLEEEKKRSNDPSKSNVKSTNDRAK